MNASETLRAEILGRFSSIHAFCVAHPELKRSTVYMVLSGRYPGNTSAQAARIRAALTEQGEHRKQPSFNVTGNEVVEALQGIRCARCRRLDRRGCMECRTQTEKEARELFALLFLGR